MEKRPTQQPGPLPGNASDAEWFRSVLAELGETQSSFARWLEWAGDDRTLQTILRSVQRMANGEARISGEMRVILNIRLRRHRRTAKQDAA